MRAPTRIHLAIWTAFLLGLTAATLRADQVQMQNGDRYAGKILSMSSNSVVLESDVLGKVTLPRNKVADVSVGAAISANSAAGASNVVAAGAKPPKASRTGTNSPSVSGLTANSSSIEQIRQQMLAGADPAASQKYNELVDGLVSGKVSVNDIRNQAMLAIGQIKELKQESGPQADASLDSYLEILENFVKETEPTAAAPTKPKFPAPPPRASFGTNAAAALPRN
jgi:hypothetical protein